MADWYGHDNWLSRGFHLHPVKNYNRHLNQEEEAVIDLMITNILL